MECDLHIARVTETIIDVRNEIWWLHDTIAFVPAILVESGICCGFSGISDLCPKQKKRTQVNKYKFTKQPHQIQHSGSGI